MTILTTEPVMLCFGYGSLVNRLTRPADEPAWPARLHGWQRIWSHRSLRADCSSLNIKRVADGADGPRGSIDGVIAAVPLSSLPALDARESGYDRVMVPADQFDLPAGLTGDAPPVDVAVYVSKRELTEPANGMFPILQSYVDCVMAGFLDCFGDPGLAGFVDSTIGWDWPMVDDRQAPRYPRAIALSREQRLHFDSLLTPWRLSA